MKSKKTLHNRTRIKKVAKIVPWREELENLGVGNLLAMNKDMLDQLGLQRRQRARIDGFLDLSQGQEHCVDSCQLSLEVGIINRDPFLQDPTG